MEEIVVDPDLVAYCGLYCGACPRHIKGRCPGCRENEKATWCKIRTCCISGELTTCADCQPFPDPHGCRKFHNPFSRIIGFFLRSDRRACIEQIRERGIEGHASAMAALGRPSMRP